jgi:hypothetical protein
MTIVGVPAQIRTDDLKGGSLAPACMVGWGNSKILLLYWRSIRFESRLGYKLSC